VIDFEKLREEEFPAARLGPYLNTAGDGLNPKCVINAMKDCLEFDLLRGAGTNYDERVYKFSDKLRAKMAESIHADVKEIALARSTSDALSAFANGIRFKMGQNVVANDLEFPSNAYAWMNLKQKGVDVRLVRNRDGIILLEDIEKAMDENTRVVTISSISMFSGARAEIEKLGALCKDRNVYFVVDAIQQLGAFDLDVKKCHVDMLASGCYKWLMVPNGVGYLFVDESILGELDVSKVGWQNVKNERDFFEVPGATYDLTFKDDASKFHESHPGVLGVYGLDAALGLISKIGIENIEQRILHLTDLLIDGAKTLGIRIVSPLEDKYRSGIVVIEPKSIEEAYAEMVRKNISVSLRSAGIRISPHFYNNEKDIAVLLEVLDNKRFRNDDQN